MPFLRPSGPMHAALSASVSYPFKLFGRILKEVKQVIMIDYLWNIFD
jgi:hypothetical protein